MSEQLDPRQVRLAKNEALWREVNESIAAAAATQGPDEHLYEFFCECSNIDCNLRLTTTTGDYDAVRRVPERFLVAPGHDLPEIEDVVERRPAVWVVAKRGAAAELVSRLDPRGG